MKKSLKCLLITGLLFVSGVVAALPVNRTNEKQPVEFADIRLPSFVMMDVQGNSIDLRQLNGKIVFVNLLASWCLPCKRELPSIEKLARLVDTGKVAFVLLSMDDRFEKTQRLLQKKKIALPVYYPAETLPALFNVPVIPATFIFNKSGLLVKAIAGRENYATNEYISLLGNG